MKKKIIALSLALTMVLTAAGCGNENSQQGSDNPPGTVAENPSDSTDDSSSQTAEPLPEGAGGNDTSGGYIYNPGSGPMTVPESVVIDELNIGQQSDPTDLGPWAGNMGGATGIVNLVYQPLFTMVWGTGGRWDPCLGKSYEEVDRLTYNVELFDYITDSLGNKIDAYDVKFSIDKAKELGKVASAKIVDEIEIIDETHIVVHFSENAALGDFEGVMTQVNIVSEATYNEKGDEFSTHPYGSGPYVLAENGYVGGSIITFEARDDYWQTDEQYIAPATVQNVKTINYRIVVEAAQRSNGLKTGVLDYANIPATDYDEFANLAGYHVFENPGNLTEMFAPNFDESSPCSDLRVRQALAYALDNQAIADMYSAGAGKAIPVWGPYNANYPDYYEEEFIAGRDAGNIYSYDPDKARQLLAEAGYADGLTLRLVCDSAEKSTNLAEILRTFYEQVGITLDVQAYQGNLMSTYTQDPTAWDIYLLSYASTDYAINVVEKVLNKAKYSWGGTVNFCFDDTLQQMLSDLRTTDDGFTKEASLAFHEYMIDNCVLYGIMQTVDYYVAPDWMPQVVMSEQRIIRANASVYTAE